MNTFISSALNTIGIKTKPAPHKPRKEILNPQIKQDNTADMYTKSSGTVRTYSLGEFISGKENGSLYDYTTSRGQILNGYMAIPWLFATCNKIATDVANVKLIPYKRTSRSEGKRATSGKIIDIMNKPNNFQTWDFIVKAMHTFRLINGDSFLHFQRGSFTGEPVPGTLRLRYPQYMHVYNRNHIGSDFIKSPDEEIVYRYSGEDGYTTYPANEICQYQWFSPVSELRGLSPIEVAGKLSDSLHSSIDWNNELTKNSSSMPGLFSTDEVLDQEDVDILNEKFRQRYNGKAGVPFFADRGMKFTPFAITPKDMDFIQGQLFNVNAIGITYNLPPQLLGVESSKTLSNYEFAVKEHIYGNVIPYAENLAKELSLAMFPDMSYYWKADIESIPMIAEDRMDRLSKLDAVSFLTENEKRIAAGYEPLPDSLMDRIYLQGNRVPIEDIANIQDREEL